jgi:hypothetical protein
VVPARTCPPGCSQPLSVPTAFQLFNLAAWQVLHGAFGVSSFSLYYAVAVCAAILAFALFQRPPPGRLTARSI